MRLLEDRKEEILQSPLSSCPLCPETTSDITHVGQFSSCGNSAIFGKLSIYSCRGAKGQEKARAHSIYAVKTY